MQRLFQKKKMTNWFSKINEKSEWWHHSLCNNETDTCKSCNIRPNSKYNRRSSLREKMINVRKVILLKKHLGAKTSQRHILSWQECPCAKTNWCQKVGAISSRRQKLLAQKRRHQNSAVPTRVITHVLTLTCTNKHRQRVLYLKEVLSNKINQAYDSWRQGTGQTIFHVHYRVIWCTRWS